MIKVNLITVKRRAPIQIPFAAIFLVVALIGILAGFSFATTQIENWAGIPEKEQERDTLEQEVKRNSDKLDHRDRLLSEQGNLRAQIEQLKQLSGASLLQWSEVFADMTNVVPEKHVWITNLRIDSDRRVQMTGYACAEEGKDGAPASGKKAERLTLGIQNFIKELQNHQHFDEVFLTNANKNTYEKATVWRFDVTCRIKRDLGAR